MNNYSRSRRRLSDRDRPRTRTRTHTRAPCDATVVDSTPHIRMIVERRFGVRNRRRRRRRRPSLRERERDRNDRRKIDHTRTKD